VAASQQYYIILCIYEILYTLYIYILRSTAHTVYTYIILCTPQVKFIIYEYIILYQYDVLSYNIATIILLLRSHTVAEIVCRNRNRNRIITIITIIVVALDDNKI